MKTATPYAAFAAAFFAATVTCAFAAAPAAVDSVSSRFTVTSNAPAQGTFTVSGRAPQWVLLRALGQGNAGCTLGDPTLSLTTADGRVVVAANDNWSSNAAAAGTLELAATAAGATPLARGSRDAALYERLMPGEYRFQVGSRGRSKNGVAGAEVFVVQAGVSPAQVATSPVAQMAAVVRAESGVPAIGAARITDAMIDTAVNGVQRRDQNTPAAQDAYFHLGSCWKAVTATLAGILVEDGVIRWDSTLADVFPELSATMRPEYRAVTLEMLLAHRGGIQPFVVISETLTIPAFSGTPREQRAAFAAWITGRAPDSPVGQFNYSNAGYGLAGAMLERVTNSNYEDLLDRRIFTPLGITPVYGWPAQLAPARQRTWGHLAIGGADLVHEPDAEVFAPYNFPVCLAPAGLNSLTMDGFARFVQMHLRGLRGQVTLLKPETIAYLHRPYGGAAEGLALGWVVTAANGPDGSTHQFDGSLDPYYAKMVIQPERNLASVSVTSATSGNGPGLPSEQAVMLLLGRTVPAITLGGEPPAEDPAELAKFALRSLVGGANVASARFRVQGDEPSDFVVRAAGPALTAANPRLRVQARPGVSLRDGQGQVIGQNTGWSTDRAQAWPLVQAGEALGLDYFALGSRDSALRRTLSAGTYTCEVSGAGVTGLATLQLGRLPPLSVDPATALTDNLNAFRETFSRQAVAVAVTRDDRLLYANAVGEADVEQAVTADADTPFLIASISKTVTAVAALQLVEAGKLNLDADINTYLPFKVVNPFFPKSKITTRQLLAHVSGLTDDHYEEIAADLFYSYGGADSPITLERLFRGLLTPTGEYYARNTFARTVPGKAYAYSNIGMALVGYIVERAAQQPFDAYCDAHIFGPLGMDHTSWRLADFPAGTTAMPYSFLDDAYGRYTFADYPDGGLFTTSRDLSVFLRAIVGGGTSGGVRILKPETVALMLKPAYPKVRGANLQGLAFYGQEINGRLLIGHNGGEMGVSTVMVFDPASNTGAVVLMNKDFVPDPSGEVITRAFSLLSELLAWGETQPRSG